MTNDFPLHHHYYSIVSIFLLIYYLYPGDFSSDTKVVLVNAINFKGKWLYPFDADTTSPQPFNLGNGITKNVPTMRRRMLCGFGSLSQVDAEFIILPFQVI